MNDFQTAAEKAANARSKAALGTEFAVDYVVVKDDNGNYLGTTDTIKFILDDSEEFIIENKI